MQFPRYIVRESTSKVQFGEDRCNTDNKINTMIRPFVNACRRIAA